MNEGKSGGWALIGKGSKVAEKVSFFIGRKRIDWPGSIKVRLLVVVCQDQHD